MKFSQNPISGVTEVYSDDGVFMGTILTTGNAIAYEEQEKRKKAIDSNFVRGMVSKLIPNKQKGSGKA